MQPKPEPTAMKQAGKKTSHLGPQSVVVCIVLLAFLLPSMGYAAPSLTSTVPPSESTDMLGTTLKGDEVAPDSLIHTEDLADLGQLRSRLPADVETVLDAALDSGRNAHLMADQFAEGPLADRLHAVTSHAGISHYEVGALPRYASLEEGLIALAHATGNPVTQGDRDRLPLLIDTLGPGVQGPILELVSALVASSGLVEQALAQIPREDRDRLQQFGIDLAAASMGDSAAAQALVQDLDVLESADQIDMAAMAAAGQVVLQTVDAVLPKLKEAAAGLPADWPLIDGSLDLSPGAAASGHVNPNVSSFKTCRDPGSFGPSPYEPPLMVLPGILHVGGPMPNAYETPVVLSIDLGTSPDCYTNNAGGNLPVGPVALAIDLGGADSYHGPNPASPFGAVHPMAGGVVTEAFVQGAGILGVGILVNVDGPDAYNSHHVLRGSWGSIPACTPTPYPGAIGPTVGYGASFVQGASFFGVGVLADLGGSDAYNSYNDLCQWEGSAPIVADTEFTVAFSQGAAFGGIGLFLDLGEDLDALNSHNHIQTLEAHAYNNLYHVSHAQGWAAGGEPLGLQFCINPNFPCFFIALPIIDGVGALVEGGGDTLYNSHNTLHASSFGVAGSHFNVSCVQGVTGLCGSDPRLEEGWPMESPVIESPTGIEPLGGTDAEQTERDSRVTSLGALVEVGGGDLYNCHNRVIATQNDWEESPTFHAWVVQGASVAHNGVGILADLAGDDCYNSVNTLNGLMPVYSVRVAQGAAGGMLTSPSGVPHTTTDHGRIEAVGILLEVDGTDLYNSANVIGASGMGAYSVMSAQGAAIGDSVIGAMFDLSPAGGDLYNSENFMMGEWNTADIVAVQGVALPIPSGLPRPVDGGVELGQAVGLLLDVDAIADDSYNSFNRMVDFGYFPNGMLTIDYANGALLPIVPPPPNKPIWNPGFAVHIDVGGANFYNHNMDLAFTGGLSLTNVHGSSGGGRMIAVFADLGPGAPMPPLLSQDTYGEPTGGFNYGLWPFPATLCLDAGDLPGDPGLNMPFGNCIDL